LFLGFGTADEFEKAYRSPWLRIGDFRAITTYLESHAVRKLQLGSGSHTPPGWLNTDIEPNEKEVYLDATGKYPFPDQTFQYIFAEHLIAHVSWEAGLSMLQECHRVLAKGGKIRIVTPNLAKYVQLLEGNHDALRSSSLRQNSDLRVSLSPPYREPIS
jgi:SAM-dependent methyltransferase